MFFSCLLVAVFALSRTREDVVSSLPCYHARNLMRCRVMECNMATWRSAAGSSALAALAQTKIKRLLHAVQFKMTKCYRLNLKSIPIHSYLHIF